MRAAAVLHVPRSAHSSVVIGYEDLARRLRDLGHELEILVPADLLSSAVGPRFFPLVFPLSVKRWLRARPDLDLVLFHSYAGWMVSGRRPAKVVAFHGLEPLFYEAQEAEARRRGMPLSARFRFMYGVLMPRMLKRACARADLVLCLNEAEREALVERGYAPADKVKMLWHDAPEGFYQPHTYRPKAVRLLAVMQWLPTKGAAYLVAAFTELARRHPELSLTIAGTMVSADDVRAAFPEDLRSRVDVRPTFGETAHRAMLSEADLFVHPSLSEGFSRAVAEAMSAGVPVVTTRTGVAAGAAARHDGLVVVPVADAPALVRAIEPLLADSAGRAALGQAGQARARAWRDADSTNTLALMLQSLEAATR